MSVIYSPTTWGPKQKMSEYPNMPKMTNQPSIVSGPVNMNVEMDEGERKVVNEFCHYLEKSKQLFNGLR